VEGSGRGLLSPYLPEATEKETKILRKFIGCPTRNVKVIDDVSLVLFKEVSKPSLQSHFNTRLNIGTIF
jgi:hypothetical protein